MAYPRLYTCDLARGRYSSASSVPDVALSAQNAVDGDPNSLYEPGAASAMYKVTLAGSRRVVGFALSNHGMNGGSVAVYAYYSNAPNPVGGYSITTPEDCVVLLSAPVQCDAVWLEFTAALGDLQIGCISILGDYGYNAAGALTDDEGFGIIEFGGNDAGMLVRPFPVDGDSGVRAVASPTFTQFQQLGAPTEAFSLPFDLMRASRDYELWRLWSAYHPRTRGEFANPGFSKGVWFTSDEYSTDAPTARYCVGVSLGYQIDQAGSRSSGALVLRTLPRDAL